MAHCLFCAGILAGFKTAGTCTEIDKIDNLRNTVASYTGLRPSVLLSNTAPLKLHLSCGHR